MAQTSDTWDLPRLQSLIQNAVPESLHLEYKRCAALEKTDRNRNELSKDVSAMANGDGGVIVYGVVENGHVPTGLDVGYDPTDISKEWIESVILSTIHPRIDGIRIYPIQVSPPDQEGRVVYVVEIPQSARGPHMAANHVYYKRFNFQAQPMEDYEVRDVGNRFRGPDLVVHGAVDNGLVGVTTFAVVPIDSGHFAPLKIEITVTNASPVPANYALIKLLIDSMVQVQIEPGAPNIVSPRTETSPATIRDRTVLLRRWDLRLAVPGTLPIWQDESYLLATLMITLPSQPIAEPLLVGYQVSAPGMRSRSRFWTWTVGPRHVVVRPADITVS